MNSTFYNNNNTINRLNLINSDNFNSALDKNLTVSGVGNPCKIGIFLTIMLIIFPF